VRRSEAIRYAGFCSHTFDEFVRRGLIHKHVHEGKKYALYDLDEIDRVNESSRIVADEAMPGTMPKTMPGKARNFADFIAKLRGKNNATY
jgi:hypothetical protein